MSDLTFTFIASEFYSLYHRHQLASLNLQPNITYADINISCMTVKGIQARNLITWPSLFNCISIKSRTC